MYRAEIRYAQPPRMQNDMHVFPHHRDPPASHKEGTHPSQSATQSKLSASRLGPTHSLDAQDDVVMLRRSACKHNDCAIKLYCHLFFKCRVIRSPISPIRTAQGNSTSQQSILCRIEHPPSTPFRFLSFLPHFSRMCTIFFIFSWLFDEEKTPIAIRARFQNCAKEPNMLTFSFFDFNSPPPLHHILAASWNKRRLFFLRSWYCNRIDREQPVFCRESARWESHRRKSKAWLTAACIKFAWDESIELFRFLPTHFRKQADTVQCHSTTPTKACVTYTRIIRGLHAHAQNNYGKKYAWFDSVWYSQYLNRADIEWASPSTARSRRCLWIGRIYLCV